MKGEFGERKHIAPTERKAETVEVSEHFKEKLSQTLKLLENQPIEHIRFLPSYEIDSNVGKLRVDVSVYSVGSKGFPKDMCNLLVKNESGQIIGLRSAVMFQVGREAERRVGADIEVGQKGKGLAIPIDLVFLKVLQEISNVDGQKIVWAIQNANLEDFNEQKRKLREEGKEDAEIAEMPEMKTLEEEQRRWQVIYGPGGKLGIEKRRKVFQPTGERDHGSQVIDTISLRRVEDSETHIASSEVMDIVRSEDSEKLLQTRREQLMKDMEGNKIQ